MRTTPTSVYTEKRRRQLDEVPDASRQVDWAKLTWSTAGKDVCDYLRSEPACA